MAKELRKITEGRVRDRDISWFPELYDKSKMPLYCTVYLRHHTHLCTFMCTLFRTKYQDTFILEYEELWELS